MEFGKNRRLADQWLPDALINIKLLTHAEYSELLGRFSNENSFIDILAKSQLMTRSQVADFVENILQIPYSKLDTLKPSKELIAEIPGEFCREAKIIPTFSDSSEIHIATSNLLDLKLERRIRFLTGKMVITEFAFQEDILKAIAKLYGTAEPTEKLTIHGNKEYEIRVDGDLASEEQSPIVRLVNRIIGEGIFQGASDIHIEAKQEQVLARVRIDGILQNLVELPKSQHSALIGRIKIISHLDIAESRKPQDGKARVNYNGHDIDLRVSVVPTSLGEKVVIRILDNRKAQISFEQMGVPARNRSLMDRAFDFKEGIVLVTGPTGSGKSTTLYAALNKMRSTANNIMTIEDPIEYRLEGINQVQVNRKAGITFATALRSFLRQDPDVILVGEIRDSETAEIAIQAALTGHLVLSTLHTNGTFATLTRLQDMGIDFVQAAESLQAIVAQRLVRRLCSQCKVEKKPDKLEAKLIPMIKKLGYEPAFYETEGCSHCNFSGYKGRVGVYEILIFDNDMKTLLSKEANLLEARRIARERGFRNLYEDAMGLIVDGVTDYREIMRVINTDTPISVEDRGNTGSSQPAAEAAKESDPTTPPKILVVEDERVQRTMARRALEKKIGVTVVEAEDGLEALEVLEHEKIDLIISDVLMPRMDGLEFIQHLRFNAATADIPVLIVTASDEEDNEKKMREVGADDYLVKPYTTKVLLERVRRLLDDKVMNARQE